MPGRTLYDLIAQLAGAREPTIEGGGSDPVWNPSIYAPGPNPAANGALNYLVYLRDLDRTLGAVGNWQASGYGLGAPMSFLPAARLDPSQVRDLRAWPGVSRGARYDPVVGEAGVPRGGPTGLGGYPWGPAWEQQMAPPPQYLPPPPGW